MNEKNEMEKNENEKIETSKNPNNNNDSVELLKNENPQDESYGKPIFLSPKKIKFEQRKLANPGSLGLCCFGISATLCNLPNAGVMKEFNPILIFTCLIYGGVAQMIAGILEFYRNNTFGMVNFISYGSFWIVLATLRLGDDLFPKYAASHPLTRMDVGFFLLVWGIFTFFFLIAALAQKAPHLLQLIFVMLFFVYVFLSMGEFSEIVFFTRIGGWLGVIVGIIGLFHGLIVMCNETFGETVFPEDLGFVTQIFRIVKRYYTERTRN